MLSFAAAGFVLAAAIVVAGGRVGAANATRPLTTWLGLQDPHVATTDDPLPGALLLAAIIVLLVLWVVVVEFVRRAPQPARRVWLVAAAWATPFAVGPPLLDSAVYNYAGFGLLQRAGHDPYTSSPARLGDQAVVAAIDPGARGTPSASGPIGTELAHLSVSITSGSALGAVLVLRAVEVLAVIWLGTRAGDLARARFTDAASLGRRDRALTLTVLNPVLLLYVVSGAHLDGLLIALVLTALALAAQRRWLAAVAAAAVSGCVLGEGWLVVVVLVVAHWRNAGERALRPRLLAAAREVGVAAVIGAGAGLAVPNGFGWIGNVGKQFSVHTPYSVAGGISALLAPVVRGASYDTLAVGGRLTAVLAMVYAVGYLLVTVGRRTPELTAGYGLLAVALLAPSLFAWYLLWGSICLAATADSARRAAVYVLAAAAVALMPSGFTERTGDVVTAVLLGLLTAVVAVGYRLATADDAAHGRAHIGQVDGGDHDRDE